MAAMRSRNQIISIAAILSASLFLGLAQTAVGQQETAEQLVERVKNAIKKDEWGRAHSGIKHALDLKPQSPEASFIAAQVYWHEGSRSQAIDFLNKAIELQPNFPEAHFLLAQCLKESNKLNEARNEVAIAINQGTDVVSAYYLLSEIDIAKGDFDSATNNLESAIRFSTGAQTDAENASSLREKIARARELVERLKQFSEVEAGQKGPDVTRPELLKPAHPGYTDEARALKIQGEVLIGLLISSTGDVESAILIRGLGHGLDERAIEGARQLKFSPATRSGIPISYWQKLSMGFYLR
jgi:TonB family protein